MIDGGGNIDSNTLQMMAKDSAPESRERRGSVFVPIPKTVSKIQLIQCQCRQYKMSNLPVPLVKLVNHISDFPRRSDMRANF